MKLGKYFPDKIESKWQQKWKEAGIYEFKIEPNKPHSAEASRGKYYNLVELPYPSGDLHIGHWFSFVPPDVHARYKKMSGFNVLFPNGFDAFGLPAENAAIKRGIHPRDWTMKNIETMRAQFETMGTMIDWNHTAITCLPEFYKWNQWIFLKMFEKGIAYRGKALSNWCPTDQTVLANEHIEAGKCWRCGTEVVQKEVEQWFLKITQYADQLIWSEDLEPVGHQSHFSNDVRSSFSQKQSQGRSLNESLSKSLGKDQSEDETAFDSSQSELAPSVQNHQSSVISHQSSLDWPKQVKEGQNNWIGRSEGIEFALQIKGSREKISVYTTRIDTVFGMTYVVLAPEHIFAQKIKLKEVIEYIKESQKKTEMERKEDRVKSGIFTGEYAINPFSGEKVPVWISDYVLVGYGTGAIMAVPGHDERDFEFAKKFGLPIKEVVIPVVIDKHDPPKEGVKTVFRKAVQVILINPENKKVLVLRWKKFPWTTFITGGVEEGEDIIEAAKREIKEEVGYTDIEYIKTLGGPVESHYYANHKQENRKALFSGLVFHLKSEKQDVISEEELSIHESIWMTWEELDKDKNIKCSEYEIWLDRLSDNPSIFTDYGTLINSGKYDGLSSKEAQDKLAGWVEEEKIGRKKINYHLRDWSISRQRYWGTPVPIIHCNKCGLVPVPSEDLPVELPYNVDYAPKGKPPLATDEQWLNVKCPNCKGEAKRDAETLDTFFDSAWYYYRYISPKYENGPFDPKEVANLMPVDVYFGGSEHTLGHTLYARFFTKFFKDINLIAFDEFAKKRAQHGVILGPDGNRMSKSRGNVVNPDDIVKEYGADTVRLYLCFMMPYEAVAPWSTTAISGIYKFLKRIWELLEKVQDGELNNEDLFQMHSAIKKVGDDLDSLQFNTAVSSLMIWLNYLSAKQTVFKVEYETLLKLLAPFAPHMAQEIWQLMDASASFIHLEKWPTFQANLLNKQNSKIVISVNGKVRGTLEIKNSEISNQKFVEDEAKKNEKVKNYLNQPIKKVIYVKGKIINFVV